MEFRIGINVGDVIYQGERLHGDGVNIAARLEGLSDAGGICISGAVYDQISSKTDLPIAFIGARQVKNIEKEQRTSRGSVNPDAYELVKKANRLGLDSTFNSHLEARKIYQRALDLDPGYAQAYVGIGWTWFDEWPFGWSDDKRVLDKALHFSKKAIDLDPVLPDASLLRNSHRIFPCKGLWLSRIARPVT
jgi:hypothetical protein